MEIDMKRIFAMVAVGISLLMLLAACGQSSADGGTTNQEETTATPTETVEIEFDIAALMRELIDQGSPVEVGDDITQSFFSVPWQRIIVHQESVQVFSYASSEAAQADADLVSPTGSTVGTSMITWVAPPHYYLRDSLLVLYVGSSGPVIDLLETIMGPQFAGA